MNASHRSEILVVDPWHTAEPATGGSNVLPLAVEYELAQHGDDLLQL